MGTDSSLAYQVGLHIGQAVGQVILYGGVVLVLMALMRPTILRLLGIDRALEHLAGIEAHMEYQTKWLEGEEAGVAELGPGQGPPA